MSVKLNQVSFRYPDTSPWLLEEVSFEVKSGTSVSLVAPSGSGKSTLFYLLGGLYSPQHGQITLDDAWLTKRGMVSYMPQNSSLFPWMTVKENIELGRKLGKRRQPFHLHDWLARAGLADVSGWYPHQLSGGMQQRVSFLRALAGGHAVVCLDEPFGSLDALTRTQMQKWLASLMDEQQTFLLITHQMEEAVLLTDHIFVFPNKLKGTPLKINNPFPKEDRFSARRTSVFWEFVLQIEEQLEEG